MVFLLWRHPSHFPDSPRFIEVSLIWMFWVVMFVLVVSGLLACLFGRLVDWFVGWLVGWLVLLLLLLWLWLFLWVLGFVNVFFFGSPLRDVLCSSSQDMLESGLQSTPHHRYVTEYHYRFYQSSKPENQH